MAKRANNISVNCLAVLPAWPRVDFRLAVCGSIEIDALYSSIPSQRVINRCAITSPRRRYLLAGMPENIDAIIWAWAEV